MKFPKIDLFQLTTVFITLKLTHNVQWGWLTVMSPTLFDFGIRVLFAGWVEYIRIKGEQVKKDNYECQDSKIDAEAKDRLAAR